MQMKNERAEKITDYIKSHERANVAEIVEYLEAFQVKGAASGTVRGIKTTINTPVQKYRSFLAPMETFLSTRSYLQRLINAQLKERNLEVYDSDVEAKNSAIKKHMLEFCARKLLEPEMFCDYTHSQLKLSIYNKQLESIMKVPYNGEALEVYQKLTAENPNDMGSVIIDSVLKWLQQLSLKELTEKYSFCGGREFLSVKTHGKYQIVQGKSPSDGKLTYTIKV